ncbi:MAG: murein transglycosylase domain-containing protein [Sulfurimonas sp.]|uniref:murein transglycosylase domain-containing protein n=1 Tax=Sulfurimonas sp. TaxID=2022749 RepID=UPI0025D6446D|nr:murein transglycosylase domain-containing protein [Sulfurimonas sp.]MCK9491349.1 murein transglycosylase domain-containing protein [Sulfurimonas sp.]
MYKNALVLICLSSALLAQDMQDYKNQQMQNFKSQTTEFETYKKTQESEFDAYAKEQKKVYDEYKKELGVFWDDPKLSTPKNWVSYEDDKKTRTDVDFEKETITIEAIAKNPEEAKEKLQLALAKAIIVDTKTVQESDPLELELKKIKKPSGVVDAKVKAEPILSTVVFDKSPTQNDVKKYVQTHVQNKDIKVKQSSKIEDAKVYTLNVALPKDTMVKRSKVYYDDVVKHADKQKLPASLVFAVMQTESSFNPRARSHIPAYGLMQIVPKSAGIDTYKFLYNEKKLVSGSYLYNSTNNITMGSAYLHILYYRYLKDIKDPTSRLYCTIAAYNTGAGNIAWAFTKTHNMKKAAPLINNKTPEEVYNKLLKDLRYDEPKHYLKRVNSRMGSYHKLYGI